MSRPGCFPGIAPDPPAPASKARPLLQRFDAEDGAHGYLWWCQGCEALHPVWMGQGTRTFDGNLEAPTFTPSIYFPPGMLGPAVVCHCYIRAGQVEYLPDCTHELAGQTVPLVPAPDDA